MQPRTDRSTHLSAVWRATARVAEMRKRLAKWKAPKPRYTSGVFHKYAITVSNASEGAVTG